MKKIKYFCVNTIYETILHMAVFNDIVPYIHGIVANISFIIMQVFFKMLAVVIPTSVVLSFQAFFLLIINSFVIVSNDKYRATYAKNNQNHDIMQNYSLQMVQNQDRLEINIKDPHIFRLVLSRLFFNAMVIWILGYAFLSGPLSIVNSLLNTAPIIIFFLEAVFYHKPLNKLHLILTVISFFGVLMVVNPFHALASTQKSQFFNMILPLIAALFASLGFIYLHELRGKVNQFVVLEYGYICQTLYFHFLTNFVADEVIIFQSANPSVKYFEPSIFDPFCVLTFILMITFSYIAHVFRLKSLFRLKPSQITPFNYIGIVLSILIDTFIFGHKSSLMEIMGILLTSVGLSSHFILAIKESKQKVEENKQKVEQRQNKMNKI